METVNLKEARRRLGDLVKAAEQGESTLITRRGRKVARVVPVEKSPRKGLPDLAALRASITVKGKPLSETVCAMRQEQRY